MQKPDINLNEVQGHCVYKSMNCPSQADNMPIIAYFGSRISKDMLSLDCFFQGYCEHVSASTKVNTFWISPWDVSQPGF